MSEEMTPTPIHNGAGEADMETPEEYRRLMNPTTTTTMPLLTEHEDTTRYTAPKDPTPENSRYTESQILSYVKSCLPGYTADSYTIEEIQEILRGAALYIADDEVGIDTIA
jgi:hypothetical protein